MQNTQQKLVTARQLQGLPVADCNKNKQKGRNFRAEITFYECGEDPADSTSKPVLHLPSGGFDNGGLQMTKDRQMIAINTSDSLTTVANNQGGVTITFTGNVQDDPLRAIFTQLETGIEATAVPGNTNMVQTLIGDQAGDAKPTWGAMIVLFSSKAGKNEPEKIYWCPKTEAMFGASATFTLSQTPTVIPFTLNVMPFDDNGNRMVERTFIA